jgi:hypothetical protein
MGVAGLLEALAVEAEEVVWPGKVRGAAIGIDISVWLHELATRHYQSVVLLKKYDDVCSDWRGCEGTPLLKPTNHWLFRTLRRPGHTSYTYSYYYTMLKIQGPS